MDQKGDWLIGGKPWLLLMGDMGSWGGFTPLGAIQTDDFYKDFN